jgi:hypothetical protein
MISVVIREANFNLITLPWRSCIHPGRLRVAKRIDRQPPATEPDGLEGRPIEARRLNRCGEPFRQRMLAATPYTGPSFEKRSLVFDNSKWASCWVVSLAEDRNGLPLNANEIGRDNVDTFLKPKR